jgi:DNA modification methylase
MPSTPADVDRLFSRSRVDHRWSFSGDRSIDTWTHGYHRYPAKFIPQVVKKIIETNSKKGDTIADLFAGCGTTLVESKVHGRKSIGIDINPIAKLITMVKTNPIEPDVLAKEYESLLSGMAEYRYSKKVRIATHPRIDYWFKKRQKHKIYFLYTSILSIRDANVRNFYLCALSNILKTCSKWLQSSTKPQIDPDKKTIDPFVAFKKQVGMMLNRNMEYYRYLARKNRLDIGCSISIADARKTNIRSNSVDTIITSPPYVTSYEYADIHQLTGYWFNYVEDLTKFRRKFIGTFYTNSDNYFVENDLAQKVVNRLKNKDKRTAREVARYFNDMDRVALEMNRILRKEGKACVVVGNTMLKGVQINTASIFTSILCEHGFHAEKIIRRRIPGKHKQIPTIRDKTTGKFTTLSNGNSKRVYPNEYIIIAKKDG